MTETELFVELLDDKEASRILRYFKESVPGYARPPLIEKKKHLLRIFKRQTANTRTRTSSKGNDPFFSILKTYNLDTTLTNMPYDELCTHLSEINGMPEYFKLVYVIRTHPNDLKNDLPNLTQKLKDNTLLFNYKPTLTTNQEAKDFYRNRTVSSTSDGIDKLISKIVESYLNSDDREEVKRLYERIANLEFKDFLELMRSDDLRDTPNHLVELSYGLSHTNEERDILLIIACKALNQVTQEINEILHERELTLVSKDSELSAALEQIAEINDDVEYIQSLQQEIQHLQSSNQTKENMIEEYQQKLSQTMNSYEEKVSQTNLSYEKQIKDLQKMHAKELQKIQMDKSKIENEVSSLKTEVFTSIPSSFAVIHSTDSKIIDVIFPEVKAVHINDWQQKKGQLMSQSITKLYVQRVGISTKRFTEIRQFAANNDLEFEVFFAHTSKELIESIGYFKHLERR